MSDELTNIDPDVDIGKESIKGWLSHPVLRRSLLLGYVVYDMARITITAVPTALIMLGAYRVVPFLSTSSQGVVSVGVSAALLVIVVDMLFPGPYRSVLSAASVNITSVAVKKSIEASNKWGRNDYVDPDVVDQLSKDLMDDLPFLKALTDDTYI
jgi:hypothetical protein